MKRLVRRTYLRLMETAEATLPSGMQRAPMFRRILCGVDGSRAAREAVVQAAALARPGSEIELMAVSCERGSGPNAQALLSHARAVEALDAAGRLAGRPGVDVVLTHRCEHSAAHALLAEAPGHDLLVLGSHGNSRAAGIMFGSTVTCAVHEAHVPVLVARHAPSDAPFPTRVLVGAEGSGSPESAIAVAAEFARAFGSRVTLLRVGGWTHPHARALDEATVGLAEAGGVEPVAVVAAGEPHRRLVEEAARERVSLIIVGSRALSGIRALASTSERVAHEAPCSVLVLRPA
jgi:nucleotide-binding universal stress UspA family protein